MRTKRTMNPDDYSGFFCAGFHLNAPYLFHTAVIGFPSKSILYFIYFLPMLCSDLEKIGLSDHTGMCRRNRRCPSFALGRHMF
nr:MAG TPA: hypothetical protein [Caudoviricetes sp.]